MYMGKKVVLIGLDAAIPKLVQRFCQEGVMPNTNQLLHDGAFTKALSALPALTPTNWTTIATGAWQGTHGINAMKLHLPGRPLNEQSGDLAFRTTSCRAEYLWEAAAKANKRSILIKYTTSWPPTMATNIIQIDGCGNPAFGSSPLEITPAACYANFPLPRIDEPIILKKGEGWSNLPSYHGEPLETVIEIRPKSKGEVIRLNALILNSQGNGYDLVLIAEGKNVGDSLASLRVGEWSSWQEVHFKLDEGSKQGALRFKLVELTPDASRIRLFRSQVYPLRGFSQPGSMASQLIEVAGPFIEHIPKVPFLWGWIDAETLFQEAEYQAKWIAKAGSYLMKTEEWDLFMTQWHFLDHAGHQWLAKVDPFSPLYSEEEAPVAWEYLRRAYRIADNLIGALTEGAGSEAVTVIVSDHGNCPVRKLVSLRNLFKARGLMVTYQDATGKEIIDWSKNRAWVFGHGNPNIYVNLRGRDPEGIIEPGSREYHQVCQEIIDALNGLRDEETGEHPIAFALTRENAALLGSWGQMAGDVVFGFTRGYGWDNNELEHHIMASITESKEHSSSSMHGAQIPTAETDISSNYATLIISGPGIKKGYIRPIEDLGAARLVDVAPTLAKIMGIPEPSQSQGSILKDFFEGHPSTHPGRKNTWTCSPEKN
ncbi:alkaline phosphatase family protein [Moorella naiadis]|uniref:alkaline phosphatase family protein n=1 Tax=Moorella naiadis (nom. illeg.) TaxID=3093670 RepID=UPI003D9CADD5